jgi:hypothetical protein
VNIADNDALCGRGGGIVFLLHYIAILTCPTYLHLSQCSPLQAKES